MHLLVYNDNENPWIDGLLSTNDRFFMLFCHSIANLRFVRMVLLFVAMHCTLVSKRNTGCIYSVGLG